LPGGLGPDGDEWEHPLPVPEDTKTFEEWNDEESEKLGGFSVAFVVIMSILAAVAFCILVYLIVFSFRNRCSKVPQQSTNPDPVTEQPVNREGENAIALH